MTTEYEVDEVSLLRDEFFDQLELGDRVTIRDEEDGDATSIDFADQVESQDD
jgi:hypothetical protein